MINLKRIVLFSLILINFLVSFSILLLINRGLEPSDTGHYYSALFHLDEIEIMTTQFAVIWSFLPIPSEIVLHRIAVYFIFIASCLFFVFKSRAFIFNGVKKHSILSTLVLLSVSLAGMATSYREWVPDPNYNVLAQITMLLVMACAFHLSTHKFDQGLKNNSWFILLGCLLLFLFLIRPPSGLATLLIVITLFLVFLRNQLPNFISIAMFMILGGLFGLFFITLLVESPLETLERVQNGLIKRDILDFNSGLKSYGLSYILKLFESIYANLLSIILVLIGVSINSLVKPNTKKPIHPRKFITLGIVGEILVIIGITVVFYQLVVNRKGYLLVLSVILVIISLGNALQYKDEARKTWLRIAIFCTFGFLLSVSNVIATVGSLMEATHTRASIFIFLSIGIMVIALMHYKQKWLVSTFLLAITSAGALHSLKKSIEKPYRLPASLMEQKYYLKKSTIAGNIKVDKESLQFYSAFYKAQTLIKTLESKPILVDLTGRMPLIQSFIEARPAKTPWLLSKKSGSNDFFEHVINRLSNEELKSAWILHAPEYKYGLDISVLRDRSINLKRDYELVANTYSPMLKIQVQLFKPKNMNDN